MAKIFHKIASRNLIDFPLVFRGLKIIYVKSENQLLQNPEMRRLSVREKLGVVSVASFAFVGQTIGDAGYAHTPIRK